MALPLILAPILAQLAAKGLDLIGSAVLAKGKDVVEKELGVNIEEDLQTEIGVESLRRLQLEHEEKLLEFALEDRKIDLAYYGLDVQDTANAREREVKILEAENAGWLNQNLVPIMALSVIYIGFYILVTVKEADIKIAVVGLMTMILGYYYGKSSSEWRKDRDIAKLSQKD